MLVSENEEIKSVVQKKERFNPFREIFGADEEFSNIDEIVLDKEVDFHH